LRPNIQTAVKGQRERDPCFFQVADHSQCNSGVWVASGRRSADAPFVSGPSRAIAGERDAFRSVAQAKRGRRPNLSAFSHTFDQRNLPYQN
jgi:hypothetical protein